MKKSVLFFFLIVVLVPGCVEHFILINVQPGGGYTLEFISRGDSTDVFNDDFSHPTAGKRWTQHVWTEKSEDDTTWIMETRGYFELGDKFVSSHDAIGTLFHPVEIEIKKRWVSTLYTARHTFKGREIYRKYPRLGESLEESAGSDSVEWITESFVYIISSALKDMEKQGYPELTPFIIERMTTHIRNYAERIKSKRLIAEISGERNAFLKILFKPFADDLQNSFYENIDDAMHPYEEELRITTGLQDDKFHFHLTMPGLLTRSNADTLAGDTLKWEFELGDFAGDDYIMEAVSVIYKTKAIQRIAVFVILASLSLWLFLWIFVFRKS